MLRSMRQTDSGWAVRRRGTGRAGAGRARLNARGSQLPTRIPYQAMEDLRTSPLGRHIAAALAWAAAAVVIYNWLGRLGTLIFVFNGDRMDFATYYVAAATLRYHPGADIYDLHTLQGVALARHACSVSVAAPYLYPPLLAILFEPLALLPCSAAYQAWLLLSAALWTGCTVLLAARLHAFWPGHARLTTVAVLAGSLLSYALLGGFALGQVHILMLFIFLLLPELSGQSRFRLAGVLLALVVCIKPQTALLLLYFMMRGRWRLVGSALAACGAFAAVMLALNGAGLPGLLHAIGATFQSGAVMAHTPWNEALGQRPGGLVLVGAVGMVFIVGLWLGRRSGDDYVGVAWTVATIVLLSPIAWWFYYGWLLPVAVAAAGLSRSLLPRAAVAALYVATIVPNVPEKEAVWLHPGVTLALWLVTGALYLRSAGDSRTGDDAIQRATPHVEHSPVAVS